MFFGPLAPSQMTAASFTFFPRQSTWPAPGASSPYPANSTRATVNFCLAPMFLKRHRLTVGEGPRLAVHRHADGRTRGGFHADHTDALQVGPVIASRLHTKRMEMIPDVGRRQAVSGSKYRQPLQLI